MEPLSGSADTLVRAYPPHFEQMHNSVAVRLPQRWRVEGVGKLEEVPVRPTCYTPNNHIMQERLRRGKSAPPRQ